MVISVICSSSFEKEAVSTDLDVQHDDFGMMSKTETQEEEEASAHMSTEDNIVLISWSSSFAHCK